MEKQRTEEFTINTLWDGFKGKQWKYAIDVRNFIQANYNPYDGDESFLAGPTKETEPPSTVVARV